MWQHGKMCSRWEDRIPFKAHSSVYTSVNVHISAIYTFLFILINNILSSPSATSCSLRRFLHPRDGNGGIPSKDDSRTLNVGTDAICLMLRAAVCEFAECCVNNLQPAAATLPFRCSNRLLLLLLLLLLLPLQLLMLHSAVVGAALACCCSMQRPGHSSFTQFSSKVMCCTCWLASSSYKLQTRFQVLQQFIKYKSSATGPGSSLACSSYSIFKLQQSRVQRGASG